MTRPERPPAISDVARRAGVSVGTVSRVLNGSTQVSERRRAVTLRAIEELGYRPNQTARALASGRHRLVGVLTGDTTEYGFASTIRGIEDAAAALGMLATVARPRSRSEADVRSVVDLLLNQPLAGVIGIEFDEQVSRGLALFPASMPSVSASLVGTHHSGLPHAHIDDELGGRLATDHLLDLGHRTVHHIAVDYPSESGTGRSYGYRAALEARGISVPPIRSSTWEPAAARVATLALLEEDPTVTAIFCFNDDLAMGAYRALHERGLRAPEDVSIIGFDDAPLSSIVSPTLSSVRMDFGALGSSAFELLARTLGETAGPPLTDVELPPVLVARESSGPPRG